MGGGEDDWGKLGGVPTSPVADGYGVDATYRTIKG